MSSHRAAFTYALAALVFSVITTRAAFAAPILPGGLNVLTGSSFPGTVVQDTVRIVPLFSFGSEVGSVTLLDRVTTSGGTTTFGRSIINDSLSGLGSPTLTSTGFTGFTSDVDYDPTSIGVSNPLIATRSSTPGDSITFDKFTTLSLAPTDQTKFAYDQTDAPGYSETGTTTITGIINGQFVSGTIKTYAPAVPEPATLSLLGLTAIACLARRRPRA